MGNGLQDALCADVATRARVWWSSAESDSWPQREISDCTRADLGDRLRDKNYTLGAQTQTDGGRTAPEKLGYMKHNDQRFVLLQIFFDACFQCADSFVQI